MGLRAEKSASVPVGHERKREPSRKGFCLQLQHPEWPATRKQIDVLDRLAVELGFLTHRHFLEKYQGLDERGLLRMSRQALSDGISLALKRVVAVRKRLREQGRSKAETPTEGGHKPETATT